MLRFFLDKNKDDKDRAQTAFEIINRAWKILENDVTRKRCLDVYEVSLALEYLSHLKYSLNFNILGSEGEDGLKFVRKTQKTEERRTPRCANPRR